MGRKLTRGSARAAQKAESEDDQENSAKSDAETVNGSSAESSDAFQPDVSSRSRTTRNIGRKTYKESESSSDEDESTKAKSKAPNARANTRTRTRNRTRPSSESSSKSVGTINSFFQKKGDTTAQTAEEVSAAERKRAKQQRRMDRSAKDMKRNGRRASGSSSGMKGSRASARNARGNKRYAEATSSEEESFQSDSGSESQSESEQGSGSDSDGAQAEGDKSGSASENGRESRPGLRRKRAKLSTGSGSDQNNRPRRTRASRGVQKTVKEAESTESSESEVEEKRPPRRSTRDRSGAAKVKQSTARKGDVSGSATASASESESASGSEHDAVEKVEARKGENGAAKKVEPIIISSEDETKTVKDAADKNVREKTTNMSVDTDDHESDSDDAKEEVAEVRSKFKQGLKGMAYSTGRRTTRSQDPESVARMKAKAEQAKAKARAEQDAAKARKLAQLARAKRQKTASTRGRSTRQGIAGSKKRAAVSESEESQNGSQSGSGSSSGTSEDGSGSDSGSQSNDSSSSDGDGAGSPSPVRVTHKRKRVLKKKQKSNVRKLDVTKINNGYSKSGRVKVSNFKNESSSSEDSEGYFVEEDKWYESITDPPPSLPKDMRLSELYIDKVLDSKNNEDAGKKGKVFQIKFHGLSYHHLRWVTMQELTRHFKSGKQRANNFLEKPRGSTFYEPDQAFNPAYLHVDRIIQQHRPKGLSGKVWFLVKWNGLDYEKATWESSSDLQDADSQQAIKLFRKHNVISREKFEDPQNYRKRGVEYQVIEESPRDFPEPYKLLDYQLEGLNWMVWQWHQDRNCILADEMGLGKTVQSVAFIHHLNVTLKLAGPFLVVAPLSTIGHWLREFETWTDLNVVLIKGSTTNRRVIRETELFHRRDGKLDKKSFKFDVILTTYEYALQEAALLKAIRFTTCILDEAHRLKNIDCKLQNQLREYRFMHQVLLTGTPLQNSVNEIWALLNYMDEPRFPDLDTFLEDFGDMKSETDVKKLQDVLHKYMLRREKRDVKKEIPQKKETIVQVELTSIQKRYYRAILERNLKVLAQGTSMPNLNNISMELRKCCIHPYLIQGCEDSVILEEKCDTQEKKDQALIHASGKMVLVDKLLKKLKAGGHKVLIFSQMTKCLDIIQDYLEAADYNFERLDGNTGGEARQQAIDRYSKKDSDGFVFLLSTKAGGVGINLTAADTVIIYDSDWNPQNDVQAQARVHRIGQKSKVEIYRLITHNTYEEEMFKKASMKLGLEQAIMGNMSSKDAKPSVSNKKMIEELVKKGAYGTLMDENDTEGNKFSAETIDEILEKRATVVVMEDDKEEGASSFAKARFEVKDTISDLNVDDPEFWTKWAERQNMDVNALMKESEDENIIYGARTRKKPKYYQMLDDGSAKAKKGRARGDTPASDSDDSDFNSKSESSEESSSGESSVDENGDKKVKVSRTTIRTEKDAMVFEKALQRYGWGRWEEIRRDCPKLCGKWINSEIAAIAQELLLMAIVSKSVSNDSTMISFVKRICSENAKEILSKQPQQPMPTALHSQQGLDVPVAANAGMANSTHAQTGPNDTQIPSNSNKAAIPGSTQPGTEMKITGVAGAINSMPGVMHSTIVPTNMVNGSAPSSSHAVPQPNPTTTHPPLTHTAQTQPATSVHTQSATSMHTQTAASSSIGPQKSEGTAQPESQASDRPKHLQWIDTYQPLTVAAGELRKLSKYRKRLHSGTIAVRLFNQLMYADWMNNTLTHPALWGKPHTQKNQLSEITRGPMMHYSPKTKITEICPFAEKWWKEATYDDQVCAVAMARHGYSAQKAVVTSVLDDIGLGKLLAPTVMKVLNKSNAANENGGVGEQQPGADVHELDYDHKKELEQEFATLLKQGNASLQAQHTKRRAADRKESIAEREARLQKELKAKAKKDKPIAAPLGNPDHWRLKDQKAFYNTAASYGIPLTSTAANDKPSTETPVDTTRASTDTSKTGGIPGEKVKLRTMLSGISVQDTEMPTAPAPTQPDLSQPDNTNANEPKNNSTTAASDSTTSTLSSTAAKTSPSADRVGGLKGGSRDAVRDESAVVDGAEGWTWTWAEFRKAAELNCTDDAVIAFWSEYKAMCEAVMAEDDQLAAAVNSQSHNEGDTGNASLKETSLSNPSEAQVSVPETVDLVTPSEEQSNPQNNTAVNKPINTVGTAPQRINTTTHQDKSKNSPIIISSAEIASVQDKETRPAATHTKNLTDTHTAALGPKHGISTTAASMARCTAKPRQDKAMLVWPGKFGVHKVSSYKARALFERISLMEQLRTVVLIEPTLKQIISRIPTSNIKRFATWFEKGADDIALYTAIARHGWDVPHTTVLDMHKDAFKVGRKQVKSLQQVDAVTKNGVNGDCWQKLGHWPTKLDTMKRLKSIIDAVRLHKKLLEGGSKRKATLDFPAKKSKKASSVNLKKQTLFSFQKPHLMSDHSDDDLPEGVPLQSSTKPMSSMISKMEKSVKLPKRRKSSKGSIDCPLIDIASTSTDSSADEISNTSPPSNSKLPVSVESTDGVTSIKKRKVGSATTTGSSDIFSSIVRDKQSGHKKATNAYDKTTPSIHPSKVLSVNSAVLNKLGPSLSVSAKGLDKAKQRTLAPLKRPIVSPASSTKTSAAKKAKRAEKKTTLMSFMRRKSIDIIDTSDEDHPLRRDMISESIE